MLIRLFARGGRIMALTGLEGATSGEAGGELAMALHEDSLRPVLVKVRGERCDGVLWWNAV
jgi:hypothetical protein